MQQLRSWWHGVRLRRRFVDWYDRGNPPWDSGIVPPEVVALVPTLPVGRALDIGCGTGTTSVYLAEGGWQVTGIDYIAAALEQARSKAAAAGVADKVRFVQGDITRLTDLSLAPPYTLAVDIGCSHGLPPSGRAAYVAQLADLLAPGGTLISYMHYPRSGGMSGLTPEEARPVYASRFEVVDVTTGTDTASGRGSAWYTMRRI